MSTSVLKALPGKLDIKRHSPSILYIYPLFIDVEGAGLRRSNLISWYLGEVESEIESETELLEKKTVIEKVLDRLVHHVSIFGP